MIDDSGHPQFDGADWPWVVNQTFPPPDSATCAQIDPLNVRQQILGHLLTCYILAAGLRFPRYLIY